MNPQLGWIVSWELPNVIASEAGAALAKALGLSIRAQQGKILREAQKEVNKAYPLQKLDLLTVPGRRYQRLVVAKTLENQGWVAYHRGQLFVDSQGFRFRSESPGGTPEIVQKFLELIRQKEKEFFGVYFSRAMIHHLVWRYQAFPVGSRGGSYFVAHSPAAVQWLDTAQQELRKIGGVLVRFRVLGEEYEVETLSYFFVRAIEEEIKLLKEKLEKAKRDTTRQRLSQLAQKVLTKVNSYRELLSLADDQVASLREALKETLKIPETKNQ